ncbi:MAG: CvpA family protein [Verrucomicrobiota bacterium]|nr:CvpA family protein [Verrucomicrobiota bacterium]
MKPDLVSGSSLWQTIFISFAVVLLLLQVLRGWRLGLPRQLVRLAALVIAYAAALFCGQMLLPLLRPLLKAPDFVLSALGGAILAALIYLIINTTGAILFKRTSQHASSLVRLVYGISGAVLGIVFGLVFIWIVVVGIRSVGAVAEAEVNASTSRVANHHTVAPSAGENSLSVTLARLKKSLEFGHVGGVVKQAGVIPGGIYDTLAKVGEVFARPEHAARFFSYPGVTELADNPKILALRADPEITRMLEEGRLGDLLQDDRLIEAANDPELAKQVKKFDLKKALEYAAQQK